MFTLITSWYHEPSEGRRAELLYCLTRNLEHPLISKVWLLVEGDTDVPHHAKLRVKYFVHRPKFNDMIKLGNEQTNIVIMANTDVYFDETLALAQYITANNCYALTRWDLLDTKLRFYNRKCSQDAWIFRPKLMGIAGNYSPGKPGCDNHLAWEMAEAGIRVTNPSKTIRACHLHLTKLRRYNSKETVPGPYLNIQPTAL